METFFLEQSTRVLCDSDCTNLWRPNKSWSESRPSRRFLKTSSGEQVFRRLPHLKLVCPMEDPLSFCAIFRNMCYLARVVSPAGVCHRCAQASRSNPCPRHLFSDHAR
ncbi:unnamed protein product, partial [Scytosiphon promiscuus]